MESLKSSKTTLPLDASKIYSTQGTQADRSAKSIAFTESSHTQTDKSSTHRHSFGESSDGLGGAKSRNTLNKSRSLYQSPSVVAEDFLKNRPNFPPNAPAVFRNPETSIITSNQLESPAYEQVVAALNGMQFFVTPPKLYIRKVAYRVEEKAASGGGGGGTASAHSAAGTESHDSPTTHTTGSGSQPANGTGRRVKLFDIKTELTPYIDTDFLLYNPGAVVDYWQDRRHRHKQIAIYKYVASSRLKSVCNSLKEQFGDQFDEFDVKITNDEYVDRVPATYTGRFFGAGCSACARWTLGLAMPLAIPFILHEHVNRQQYEAGFVFRIRKRAIDVIERDLTRIMEQMLQPLPRLSSISSGTPSTGSADVDNGHSGGGGATGGDSGAFTAAAVNSGGMKAAGKRHGTTDVMDADGDGDGDQDSRGSEEEEEAAEERLDEIEVVDSTQIDAQTRYLAVTRSANIESSSQTKLPPP